MFVVTYAPARTTPSPIATTATLVNNTPLPTRTQDMRPIPITPHTILRTHTQTSLFHHQAVRFPFNLSPFPLPLFLSPRIPQIALTLLPSDLHPLCPIARVHSSSVWPPVFRYAGTRPHPCDHPTNGKKVQVLVSVPSPCSFTSFSLSLRYEFLRLCSFLPSQLDRP